MLFKHIQKKVSAYIFKHREIASEIYPKVYICFRQIKSMVLFEICIQELGLVDKGWLFFSL